MHLFQGWGRSEGTGRLQHGAAQQLPQQRRQSGEHVAVLVRAPRARIGATLRLMTSVRSEGWRLACGFHRDNNSSATA